MPRREGTTKGFKQSAALLGGQIRHASESRGFAVSRVLTHWAEIAGAGIANIAKPVKISYGHTGFGATLTVLTTGAQAPMLEMQKEKLRERVNAAYGYNAISKILITQTSPTGFAEGQTDFAHKPQTPKPPRTDGPAARAAACLSAPVTDDSLRQALEVLGRNVLSKSENNR